MNEPKCPVCGKPLSLEYGTYYCHGCKLTIEPSVLDVLKAKEVNNG